MTAVVEPTRPESPADAVYRADSTGPGGLPALTPELVGLLDVPAEVPDRLSIAGVSELTGVSTYTLRYWERIGLLTVGRNRARRRVYDRDGLAQVLFIRRLRLSEMPIETIRRYVALVNAGEHTVDQRLELMRAHRAEVRRRLEGLQAALTVLDHKIASYGGDDAAEEAAAT